MAFGKDDDGEHFILRPRGIVELLHRIAELRTLVGPWT
jgi:hypothetical protein